MKRVLIISPHFPPVNTADMHRVRQSLPYYKAMGWEPVVITVDAAYIEAYSIDPLLLYTIPSDIEVHKVKAWEARKTRKFGLGSLSMRSYFHFQKKGDELLGQRHFDLIFFSTTAFHVMALGPGWKKKFNVPFVLDIQDPWRNDFYLDKPKAERPPKFLLSYTIDKKLEAKTVPAADGIIAVSQEYCDTFLQRYPSMHKEQFRVIPFGAFEYDFEVMRKYITQVERVQLKTGKINLVYIGRGGHDMRTALEIIFTAVNKGLKNNAGLFAGIHLWFIGTSYAPAGQGYKTIEPIAQQYGVMDQVTEITDRIPYFEALYLLDKADILVIPGSTDEGYTASKLFPYLLAKKNILAVFNKKSSVIKVLKGLGYDTVVSFDNGASIDNAVDDCYSYMQRLIANKEKYVYPDAAIVPLLAASRTAEQVAFFNEVVTGKVKEKTNG